MVHTKLVDERSHEPTLATKPTVSPSCDARRVRGQSTEGAPIAAGDARIATIALSDQEIGLIEKIVDSRVTRFSVASGNAGTLPTEVVRTCLVVRAEVRKTPKRTKTKVA